MRFDSTNLQPPFLGPGPVGYPHLRQMVRVIAQSGSVSLGYVQQWQGSKFRDREPCFIWEINDLTVPKGIFKSRLVGTWQGLPLYALSLACCTGKGSISSSSASSSSRSSAASSSPVSASSSRSPSSPVSASSSASGPSSGLPSPSGPSAASPSSVLASSASPLPVCCDGLEQLTTLCATYQFAAASSSSSSSSSATITSVVFNLVSGIFTAAIGTATLALKCTGTGVTGWVLEVTIGGVVTDYPIDPVSTCKPLSLVFKRVVLSIGVIDLIVGLCPSSSSSAASRSSSAAPVVSSAPSSSSAAPRVAVSCFGSPVSTRLTGLITSPCSEIDGVTFSLPYMGKDGSMQDFWEVNNVLVVPDNGRRNSFVLTCTAAGGWKLTQATLNCYQFNNSPTSQSNPPFLLSFVTAVTDGGSGNGCPACSNGQSVTCTIMEQP